MAPLRAVVLTDSAAAVKSTFETFTSALRLRSAWGPRPWKYGVTAAVEGEGVVIEVVEVGFMSRLRRLRGAPTVGALVSLRRRGIDAEDAARGVPWDAVRDLCVRNAARVQPARVVGGDLSGEGAARSVLAEVVFSTTGVDAAAFEEVRRLDATGVPGIYRAGCVDVRLQPLAAKYSAIVLRCRDVDEAAASMAAAGTAFERVGKSGFSAGQLVVGLPWCAGLEVRLSQAEHPEAQFHESHGAILAAPDVLPELQRAPIGGGGDCWMEARAMLRRPGGFFFFSS